MPDTAISVQNLSKRYRIGKAQQRHDTLRDALATGLRGACQRLSSIVARPSSADERPGRAGITIWALRDVSFEVQRGEVVGIIGRNGAGKSTLLKILSQITEPTEGRVVLDGRVGSLLEVGTGFHPELTGRENIYLSGAILGMRREQIERKFDEIVDFSGVERFIDTPIKRYSSGMNVRLGFAVAAHLEPEILLVDEVLAVGDAAFQRKCLGKMEEVGLSGRTVVFVSHNMAAVQNLCKRALLMEAGQLTLGGEATETVSYYLKSFETNAGSRDLTGLDVGRRGTGEVRIRAVDILSMSGEKTASVAMGGGFKVRLHLQALLSVVGVRLGVSIHSAQGQRLCGLNSHDTTHFTLEMGTGETAAVECVIPRANLSPGTYTLTLSVWQPEGQLADAVTNAVSFDILPHDVYGTGRIPAGQSVIFLDANWERLTL